MSARDHKKPLAVIGLTYSNADNRCTSPRVGQKVVRMPVIEKLNDKKIKATLAAAAVAAKPKLIGDGGGLLLEAQPSGSGWWRVRYTFGGRENRLSVGKYRHVTLADARQRRREVFSRLPMASIRVDVEKPPTKTSEGIPLIKAKNVRMGCLVREPREFISSETFDAWMTRGSPQIGDLFFTTEAPLANVCLNDIGEPFALAQRVICLQPYGRINTRFLMFALMSESMQSLIDAHATGMTAKGIKAAKLKPLPIPIPALAEQSRIVAKVDELMALCDRLEANLPSSDTHRRRLLEALLHEALQPAEEIEAAV